MAFLSVTVRDCTFRRPATPWHQPCSEVACQPCLAIGCLIIVFSFSGTVFLMWLRYISWCLPERVHPFSMMNVWTCSMVGPSSENGPIYIIWAAFPSENDSNLMFGSATEFFYFLPSSMASVRDAWAPFIIDFCHLAFLPRLWVRKHT